MLAFGIDISNHTMKFAPWMMQWLRDQQGIREVVSSTYDEEIFRNQMLEARNAGMVTEAYVFLDFRFNITAQVQDALDKLDRLSEVNIGRLWLDFEDEKRPDFSPGRIVDMVHEAARACEGRRWSGIYTRREWWMRRTDNTHDFKDFPLWDCTFDRTADLIMNWYGGWTQPVKEQYLLDIPVPELGGRAIDYNFVFLPDPPKPPAFEPAPPEEVVPVIETSQPIEAGTSAGLTWEEKRQVILVARHLMEQIVAVSYQDNPGLLLELSDAYKVMIDKLR